MMTTDHIEQVTAILK